MTLQFGIHVNGLDIWKTWVISPLIRNLTRKTLKVITPIITQRKVSTSLTTIPTIKLRLLFCYVCIFYRTEFLFAPLALIGSLSFFSSIFLIGEVNADLIEIGVTDGAA